ncbi:MAG: radical SAM protein, partial [Maricaulaceae bacterium]
MTVLPDALQPRGRGARSNRSSRFEPEDRDPFDDGWSSAEPPARPLRTEVGVDAVRTIITRNQSPDLSFDRSINPYKGCEHGCVYCYARPSHAYLGLSAGLDFESRIFAKPDAAERLRAELADPKYQPAPIVIGANTDPYQPVERRLEITRSVLAVLAEARHPVSLITKSALILRDLDLLGPMAAQGLVKAAVSVTTLDRALARSLEPRAATPGRRIHDIKGIFGTGLTDTHIVAPIIPALI